MGLKTVLTRDGHWMITNCPGSRLGQKTCTTDAEAKRDLPSVNYIEQINQTFRVYQMTIIRCNAASYAMFQIDYGQGKIDEEDSKLFIGYSWYGYQTKTLQDLDNEFGKARIEWESSEECNTLKVQLRTTNREGWAPVTNIVPLSIGSLHASLYVERCLERSRKQLAALLTIREVLSSTFEETETLAVANIVRQ